MSVTWTDRQLVLAQREAYARGARDFGADPSWAERDAARRFPLPTVTRPREMWVIDIGRKLRVVNGVLECDDTRGGWRPAMLCPPGTYPPIGSCPRHVLLDLTDERIAIVHDLFANPTEEVEAE